MKALTRHLAGDSLEARSIRSFGFTALSFGGGNLLRLAGNLALTRILFPEAFGLMALVQIVLTGLTMFSDIGIRASIVRDERGEEPAYLDTAWVLQIMRGLLLWAMTWILAAPVAAFYEAPVLEQMLPVAGLAAVFQGLNSTKMQTANRALTLGRVTALGLGAQALGLVATIALALWLKDVWALVIGGLVGPVAFCLMSHLLMPGRINRLFFERDAARNILGLGVFVFIASAATFISINVDRAILGKFVSLDQLALYNIGLFLATVPMQLLKRLVEIVLYPLYAARPPRDNPENLRKIGQSRATIIALALFGSTFLALIGVPLIALLYDPRYHDAGPLMVLIALAQMPEIISTHYALAIMAAGNGRRFALFLCLVAGLKSSAMLFGAMHFGVIGVAIAPALAMTLFYPVAILLVRPYGVWIPRHDLAFIAFILIGAGGVLWINWANLAPLF
jgi:O-antigen/teichoic acid export membrane protein